ncbi:transport-associated protein [Calothrix sp. NIES-2100]|uniref:BON domain-containing protein n=1 Tax=Calothrix sp. NIES-2100 TaxID=1954172 RepID=UPI000B5FBC57|nr:transport-associated protein [Calothrix sp. NIES-2100]
MKKLIPLLVSSILVIGAVGCQESKNAETPSTTNEASQPAKEASANTKTTAKTTTETGKTAVKETAANTKTTAKTTTDSTAKSAILGKLSEKIPGSKLVVEDKDGVVTVTGTVPTQADIKKIEPLVKEQKGVKSVKVEVKPASAKAQ